MFDQKELDIIKYGKEKGKTQVEVLGALTKYRASLPKAPVATAAPNNFMTNYTGNNPGRTETIGDIKQIGTGIKDVITSHADRQAQIMDAQATGQQSDLSTKFQTTTNLLSTVGGVAGELFVGLGKTLMPQAAEDKVKEFASGVGQSIMESPRVQQFVQNYKDLQKEDPVAARNVVALAQGGEFLLNFVGLKLATDAADATIQAGKSVGGRISTAISERVAAKAERLAQEATTLTKEIKSVADGNPGFFDRIVERFKTNWATKKAKDAVIESLPTDIAKSAAKEGVNPSDIKLIYSLPKEQAAQYRELATTVKNFAAGDKSVDPVEIVGKPIIARIKELEATKASVGKQLGEVANGLGRVTKEQLQPAVFDNLKAVSGLTGLKLTPSGALDFTDTVLSTTLTKADRVAIRQIYDAAIANGTGKSKHLLRQELFETLGGKKGSLQALTDTQDKAFNAVRKGLSDVLDSMDGSYKSLSAEYAKVATPLKDMKKLMGKVSGADEDLANMSAGLLARRITSMAKSNPEIQSILRALDQATAQGGKTAVSVEAMQNLYNILSHYYDISAETGFQGQIKNVIDTPSGAIKAGIKKIVDLGAETPAVRQKAIEKILEEALR